MTSKTRERVFNLFVDSFISVQDCSRAPSQSHLVLDFLFALVLAGAPGVEGEEITQRAEAEFSRTKDIWVKVTQ